MKKLLVLLSAVLCVLSVNAQYYDEKKNEWALEAGVGGTGSTAVNLGLRWQHNFHPYIAWDVLNLNAVAPTDDFGQVVPQLMTGLRLKSPEFAGLKLYAIGHVGYGVNVDDTDLHGLVFEVGGGIQLTEHFYVGYAYNHQDLGTIEVRNGKHTSSEKRESKYHAFRIGWIF